MYSFNNKSKTIRTMKKYIQPEVQEKKSLINDSIMLTGSPDIPDGGNTGDSGVTEGDAKLRDEWSDGLW